MKSVGLLVLLVAVVHTAIIDRQVCKTNSDCKPGDCCQPLVIERVVSKRSLSDLEKLLGGKTCVPYKLEGETCDSYLGSSMCNCEPGTQCRGKEVKRLSRRRIIAPRPGYMWQYTCTKE